MIKFLYRKALRNIEIKNAKAAYRQLSFAILLRNDQSNLYIARAKAGVLLRHGKKVNEDLKQAIEYAREKERVQMKVNRIRLQQATLLEVLAEDTLKVMSAPNSALASQMLKGAKFFEAEGDSKRALRMYNSAVRNMPEDESMRYERACAYLRIENYSAAIKDFTWIIDHNSEFCEAYIGRGKIKYIQGNISEAIQDFSKAKTADPSNYDAVFNFGVALREEGKYLDHAIKQFDVALQIQSDSVDALIERGKTYLLMTLLGEAIDDFDLAQKNEPLSGRGWYWLGNVALAKKDKNKAIDAFNNSLNLGWVQASGILKNIKNPSHAKPQKNNTDDKKNQLRGPDNLIKQKAASFIDAVLASGDVKITQEALEKITGIDQTNWPRIMKRKEFWDALDEMKNEKRIEAKKQLSLLNGWDIMADPRRRKVVEGRPSQEKLTSPAVLERTNRPSKKKNRSPDEESVDFISLDEINSGDAEKSDELTELSSENDPYQEVEDDYDLDKMLNALSDDDLRKGVQHRSSQFDRSRLTEMTRIELIEIYKSLI
jgi:tetratricopeptide (TPR) repeat protein